MQQPNDTLYNVKFRLVNLEPLVEGRDHSAPNILARNLEKIVERGADNLGASS